MAKAQQQNNVELKNQALEKSNSGQDDLTLQNTKSIAADLINDFSNVDVEQLQGMTQEYLQMKENTTYNMVFTGMTSFKGEKGGDVESVVLVDQNAKSFINGNTVLVGALRKVKQMPCLVRIVTHEYVKSSNGAGKYLDMDVYVLPKVTAG
jgi:hypothetical protein